MKKAILLIISALIFFAATGCMSMGETDIEPQPTETPEQSAIEPEQPSASAQDEDEPIPGVFSRESILEGIGEWAEKESGLTKKGGYFFDESDEFRKNISGYTAIELSDGSVFGYLDFTEGQHYWYRDPEGYVAYGPIVSYVNDFVSKEAQKAWMDSYVDCSSESAFFIISKDTESRVGYYMNCKEGFFWEMSIG